MAEEEQQKKGLLGRLFRQEQGETGAREEPAAAPAGDDAVALREDLPRGRLAEGHLGDDRAGGDHLLADVAVALRVVTVD